MAKGKNEHGEVASESNGQLKLAPKRRLGVQEDDDTITLEFPAIRLRYAIMQQRGVEPVFYSLGLTFLYEELSGLFPSDIVMQSPAVACLLKSGLDRPSLGIKIIFDKESGQPKKVFLYAQDEAQLPKLNFSK